MEYKKFDSRYVVRIDRGEEVVSSLKDFIRQTGIQLAQVEGIGAADEIKIGHFFPETKKYSSHTLTGAHEITSLKGNISR